MADDIVTDVLCRAMSFLTVTSQVDTRVVVGGLEAVLLWKFARDHPTDQHFEHMKSSVKK
jgi:hypothetical protein